MGDCTTFINDSFDSLRKFSDAFNVSPFVLVVVGTAITHHSLLTSLWVNVSHFPLKIFLSPLTSNATVVSGQMALLSYVARAVWEGQAQWKPIPRTGTREMDPTLESDHGLNVGLNPQRLKQDQAGLMPSKKDQLNAASSKTPMLPTLPWDSPQGDTPPPPPLPSPARTHNTPKGQNAHPSGSVASLLAQFQQSQQSRSQNASPKGRLAKGTLVKDTPKKDTPKKGEQTPGKKILTSDKSTEPPVKKQQTGSPSSDQGSKTDHGKTDKSKKKKKRKKKEPKSEPTVATDSETEETKEQQKKCQRVRKWKAEY